MTPHPLAVLAMLAAAMDPLAPGQMAGTWSVSGPVNPTCHFTQAGASFRGTCITPTARGVAFGTVDGDHVRWSFQAISNTDNSSGISQFVGRLDGPGHMDGAMTGTMGTGSFTAERQSPDSF